MGEPLRDYAVKSDFAYDVVRGRILTTAYPPGTTFNQAALAAELGISTTPLREALRRLAAENLVTLGAHRDAQVTRLTSEEARDLLEIRLALDPLAAGLAASRRTHEDIAAIRARSAVEALPAAPTIAQLISHRRFHQAIYRASHNDLLIETLDTLWDKADRYRMAALTVHRTAAETAQKDAEHHELMSCVISGDADGAAEVMRRHIQSSLGVRAARLLADQQPT
ncbi:GntR family transcriptional regulator [Microbacterium kribbense]|uniref:GntR family transcriptional regulator n=1 Tax=Microbacterium kribbense TaxID=433645 RepID=A0ABP7G843_9MICO